MIFILHLFTICVHVYMCASMFMYHGTCVEVQRQFAEFSSLLSSCGSQELSLGHQIWWWVYKLRHLHSLGFLVLFLREHTTALWHKACKHSGG